ncbi:Vacuolar protein sorting-associated protein 52 A, partial [Neolecta irregularis DAH-3]
QDRSINLSRHLQNRKAVDQLLGPVIDDIVISPATIMRLSESDINDAWLKDLDEVERKIDLLNVGRYRKVAAVNEVHPYLEKLQIKIIERTRNFIVDLIKAIRFPDANLSSLQQLSFLRCTRPFSFLKRHNEQLATELGQAYVNTLRWYYTSHFERFSKILSKLQYRLLDRSEVLAKDTRVSRGGLFAAAAALTKPLISEEPFQLGDRIKILTSQESNIINSHMAEDTKRYFHLETIFNSFNYVLIDNASAEYLFLVEFFGYSNDRTSSIFQEIFQPSFNIGMVNILLYPQTHVKNLISTFISENTDVHGLLLCIRLTQAYAFELQRRRIPVLENYINAILIHLWPRFQRAMDTHGESLRKNGATMKPFQNNESDTVPHPLTQQFAQFLQGILSLETIDAENEPINSRSGFLPRTKLMF